MSNVRHEGSVLTAAERDRRIVGDYEDDGEVRHSGTDYGKGDGQGARGSLPCVDGQMRSCGRDPPTGPVCNPGSRTWGFSLLEKIKPIHEGWV